MSDLVFSERLGISWHIDPVTASVMRTWRLCADGLPRLSLVWGTKRRRPLATLAINPTHGKYDSRLASVAFETGPLPEYGVDWTVTWHTWDHRGTGGENSSEADLATAIEQTLYRCLVQGFITSLRTAEAEGVLRVAQKLSAEWRKGWKLNSIRWGYSG